MSWYDPEIDPWDDDEADEGDDMKFTPDSHPDVYFGFVQGLRKQTPKARTSTFKADSPNAILGEAGEIVLTDRIRKVLEDKGLNWTVGRTSYVKVRSIDLGPCPEDDDPWEAIDNSKQGDVHVVDHRGHRRFSFEVKASMAYDNATISESELLYSEADYLAGVTRAGLWVCTMREARRVAREKHGAYGKFYVIPFDLVKRVPLESIFPDV
jgi:hypothetical protein